MTWLFRFPNTQLFTDWFIETIHQITKKADAGEIIHQCLPELLSGDNIHDVGARCVVKARDDLKKVLTHWKSERGFKGVLQKTSGRN